MKPIWTRNQSLYRAIATMLLACLVALSPTLLANSEKSAFAVTGQASLGAGWTICSSDGSATDNPDKGGFPAHKIHHHCALCSALATPLEPSPEATSQPALYRVVATIAYTAPTIALRRSGWSTSWSSRAPPIDA
jgi:hypothetical protein